MICERARERGMDLLVELSWLKAPPLLVGYRVVGRRIECAATGRLLGMSYDPGEEIPF